MNDWGNYEFVLFGNVMFCLDKSKLLPLLPTLYKRMEKYADSHRRKDIYALVLLNAANTCLEMNELEIAQTLLGQCQLILKNSKYFFEINHKNYLKGILEIKKGNVAKGKKICKDAIEVLVHFENFDNAQAKEKELKKLLREVESETLSGE